MVLYISKDKDSYEEVDDFFSTHHEKVMFSDSTEKSFQILTREDVNIVLLYVQTVTDVAILKYINENYPEIKVFITADKTFDELISIFNRGSYTLIHEPFRVSSFRSMLEEMNRSIKT